MHGTLVFFKNTIPSSFQIYQQIGRFTEPLCTTCFVIQQDVMYFCTYRIVSTGVREVSISDDVDHLNSLLPLKARQDALDPALRDLHQQILRSFAATGQPLSREQIAAQSGAGRVDDLLAQLAADDLVVLSADMQEITGAYPFTIEERVHHVDINGQAVYAMCALDALSIAPMCQASTRILSSCHVTGTPIDIQMNADKILVAIPADVHVGIRWQATSGCAAKNLCMEMVYLKDAATAKAWQQQDNDNISIYSLNEAVEFGAAFFKPLLAA